MSDESLPIHIVVAMTKDRVIGKDNRLPWHIPAELQLFKQLTLGNTIIMGRKTFQSIGRPLPGRNNIVLSSTLSPLEGIQVARSLEEAFDKGRGMGRKMFVIGGAQVFRETLPIADGMYISWIHHPYRGDLFFPCFDAGDWCLEQEQSFNEFTLCSYSKSSPGCAELC